MAFQSAPFNDNASIISSAISTKSKSSKRKSDAQSIVSLTPSAVYAYSRSVSPTSLLPPIPSSPATQPAKNTLSIRLAESAVFLRTNDATGRNRYNDSRPTFLRGIVQLELVKPTRISRIVLELGAKSVTVWPEGTHGRDLTEAHKVFSATETVFSAVAKRDRSASRDRPSGEWDSFVSFEDDTPPVSPSIGSGTGGWSSGWISPDVRSIQSQTSGTITPTTRRALSADSGRTRRALPDPPIQTLSGEPPPYAPDYTTEASPESPILTGTYSESRISFQSGVNVSRDRAPGRKSKSKPRRPRGDAPGAPLPAIPPVPPLSEASSSSVSASSTRPLPTPPAELSYDSSQSERYPYSSATFTSTRSKLVAREPLVSTEFIASPLPSAARSQYEFDSSHIPPASSSSQADTQAEELNHPRETGFDPYQYARSHAQAHLQSSLPVGSSSRAHSQSEQPSSSRSHNNDDDDDTPRGRKRSRFSLASLGSRLVHAFSKSRSRSRSVSSKRPENKVRDSAEDAHTDRDNSPSRVSTRSGYSGISTASAVSGVTTVSTDSKKSNKRSLSLPWKKKRSSTVTTTSQMSGVSQGSSVSRATTDISQGERGKGMIVNEMGLINVSTPPDGTTTPHPPLPLASISSRSATTTTSASSTSSQHSQPPSITSARRPSPMSRSVSSLSGHSSDTQSHITFADSPAPSMSAYSTQRPPSLLSGISGFSALSKSSKERDRDTSKEREKDGEGPGWREFPKGTYSYPILFPIPGHAPPTLDTASSHQKPWKPSSNSVSSPGGGGGGPNRPGSKDTVYWGGLASGTNSPYGAYGGIGDDDDLPHCTLRWQLKASVHRPGAFASKMQVTREVLVVSGPSEDDGEDALNGGGESVVVERTWDGGMGSGPAPGSLGVIPEAGPHPSPPPPSSSFLDISGSAGPSAPVPSPTAGLSPPPLVGSGGNGSLQYLITISGRSFCIGGAIPLEITLMPLDKIRIHRLGVVIEQKIEYHTHFKRVARTDPLLTVPLLALREEGKDKELKHILPLESDDPDALKQSPLWKVMRKSLLSNIAAGWEGDGDGEGYYETEVDENADDYLDDTDEDMDDFDLDDDHDDEYTPSHARLLRSPPFSFAVSELASSLMGPGPWTIPLSLPLPISHASNLTPKQMIDHQRQIEERAQQAQQQWGLGGRRESIKKVPDLVDVGRGLLPSNKNKRSNVAISHLLKCVIRVEKGGVEEPEEQDEPMSPVAGLADIDRSGWDNDWERVQANKEMLRQDSNGSGRRVKIQEPRKPKPKKKRKLFDIVVQTPIQILSCRCNPEFASLPGYTPADYDPTSSFASDSQSQLDVTSNVTPSSSLSPSSLPATISSAIVPTSDCCPCVMKAKVKQAQREMHLTGREERRAQRLARIRRREEIQHEKEKVKVRRREGVIGLPGLPPTAPLPLPPRQSTVSPPPSHMSLPSPPPSSFSQACFNASPMVLLPPPPPAPRSDFEANPINMFPFKSRSRAQQRMSSSSGTSGTSGSTSYTSGSSAPGSILRNSSKRSSGFSGLGLGGVITTKTKPISERRLTGGSQMSTQSYTSQFSAQSSLALTGGGGEFTFGQAEVNGMRAFQSSREFESLVAGHMDEAGEAPPMYDQIAVLFGDNRVGSEE